MIANTSVLERAFDLAASGRFASLDELKKRLKFEGYTIYQIEGRQVVGQLIRMIADARMAQVLLRDPAGDESANSV